MHRLLPTSALVLALPAALCAQADLATMMPTVADWTKKDSTRYKPENLFEYINGAADGFVDCGFKELLTQTYEAANKTLVTVEIYRHDSPITAFGIYSQERPLTGTFLNIGGQGYVEEGILNFFKGECYVKISGNNLGPKGKDILQAFATATAAHIPGEGRMPSILEAFPKEGRVAQSERFLLKNVLGYAFLNTGFLADYGTGDKAFKMLALVSKDEKDAEAMLAQYLKTQESALPPAKDKVLTLKDKFNGPVSLLWSGTHILAALGANTAAHAGLLQAMKGNLK